LREIRNDKCIGTGSLYIEEKEEKKVGHIEDFIIDENYHG
jgi:hypothetical protein